MNPPTDEQTKRKKVVRRRVIVAVWGIPLLMIPTLLGGWYFTGLIAVIAGLAVFEYLAMMQKSSAVVSRVIISILAAGLVLVTRYNPEWALGFIIICSVSIVIVSYRGVVHNWTTRIGGAFAGFFYIAGFLTLLSQLRSRILTSEETIWGGVFVIYLFSCIWICDSCAYFGGIRFGKHKLAPTVSPGKTIEGAIFGFIGALLWSIIGILALGDKLPWLFLVLTAGVGGSIGQLGDLIESAIKRNAGVKDSGHLLPEHGGIFDRFDSIIFSSPFIYLLAYFFGLLSVQT